MSSKIDLRQQIATTTVQNVCELPDYNSPEDQPDLVMCTVQELERCVLRAFETVVGDETTPRHLQPRYVLEQIMKNSTDHWAQGVARTCLMQSPVPPAEKASEPTGQIIDRQRDYEISNAGVINDLLTESVSYLRAGFPDTGLDLINRIEQFLVTHSSGT